MICGRSSCATEIDAIAKQRASKAPAIANRDHISQCKILRNVGARSASAATIFELGGEISMKVNDKAPDFTLQDENGTDVALKDLRGKTVILFFYPRANTPG